MSMYEYHNRTLCVKHPELVNKLGIKKGTYDGWVSRGHLKVVRPGKGMGNYALIEFESMRADIRKRVEAIEKPNEVSKSMLYDYIVPTREIRAFFIDYRKPTGEALSDDLIDKYTTNALLLAALSRMRTNLKSQYIKLGGSNQQMWKIMVQALKNVDVVEYNHNLPLSWRKLEARVNRFEEDEYYSVIHGNSGNENRTKIKGEAADWLLATYCLPNKPSIPEVVAKYNTIREDNGWEQITHQALYKWLEKPTQKRIWMLGRNGKNDYNNAYKHKLSRDKSNWFPNVFWAIDGSKLDWVHYIDNPNGANHAAQLKVTPVVDVYSEKIIGISMGESEAHAAAFVAIKDAVRNTGVRPYLINYDQQSGHKMQRMQDLYSSIVAKEGGTHFPNRAYSHANPMEQLFGRIQKQVFNKLWFSDKQSVKAKRLDNQMNSDFVLKHKHLLKSKEELIKWLDMVVKQWNEAEHPHFKGQSRNEVYNHEMKLKEEVGIEELSTMFWLTETKPIKYAASGLQLTVSGETYTYEMFDAEGNIDLEFRRKYVGEKLVVRYDTEFLNEYVQLFYKNENGGLVHVGNAQPKRKHENVPALMKEGARLDWIKDYQVQEMEYERDAKALQELRAKTGITEESLIEEQEYMLKHEGKLPKYEREALESILRL